MLFIAIHYWGYTSLEVKGPVRIAPPSLRPCHSGPATRDFQSSISVEALFHRCHLDVQGLLHQQLLSSSVETSAKLFSEFMLVTDNLLSIYEAANWESHQKHGYEFRHFGCRSLGNSGGNCHHLSLPQCWSVIYRQIALCTLSWFAGQSQQLGLVQAHVKLCKDVSNDGLYHVVMNYDVQVGFYIISPKRCMSITLLALCLGLLTPTLKYCWNCTVDTGRSSHYKCKL